MPRLRVLVPNAVTSLSLVFATASLIVSLAGEFETAAWFVVWCVLLDKADGALARRLDACTDFGLQLDSLVDLVAFGVAPATLAYGVLAGPSGVGVSTPVAGGVVTAYLLCAAWRLALYNATPEASTSASFRGIPSTLAGGIVVTGYLTWLSLGASAGTLAAAGPTVLLGLGLLMISPLPLPKIARRKYRLVHVGQTVAITFAYVVGILRVLPEALFVLAVGYTLIGLLVRWVPSRHGSRPAEGAA